MGLRLSSLGVGRIAGTILFFIGLGVYQAYAAVNHALFYTEVPVTVTAVKQACAFDSDSSLYTGEMRWGSCGTMSEASSKELKAQHMVMKHDISFAFTSPADGKAHEGNFTIHGASNSAAKHHAATIRKIWANDSDPTIYERFRR